MSLSRRQFVIASAAIPAVWVTPQILSVPIASATDLGSRPPSTPPKTFRSSQPQMGPPIPDGIPAQLAYTGPNVERDAQLGVTAVVAGAGIAALAHTPKREPLS